MAVSWAIIGLHTSLAILCIQAFTHHEYDGHKVFRLVPQTERQLKLIRNLLENPRFDVWQAPTVVGQPIDVQVPPEHARAAKRDFRSQGIQHNILVNDLRRKILEQLTHNEEARSKAESPFENYHNLSYIMSWVMNKANHECGKRCELFTIGNSFEGVPLRGIKIGTPGINKQSIWIDGGIHAREWIAPSTAMYIIERLVGDYGPEGDPVVTEIVDMYDWYILPVINPDGYKYSWEKDRMWRKTRSVSKHTDCVGVDANRNYDFKWMSIGASSDPCSNTFGGFAPMTEAEAKAQSTFMLNHDNPWKLFLTLHSYNQLWMTPWGYTDQLPPNFVNMMTVANEAVNAIKKVNGTSYRFGPASIVLYQSSGTSRDWAAGVAQIPYVYTIELRDQGQHGFLLPPEQILPTCKETWAGIKALVESINDIDAGRSYEY